jgi:hypothetical protein
MLPAAGSRSDSLFDDRMNPPSFIFAQRPALFDHNHVADSADVFRVICHILDAFADKLTVQFVADQPVNLHDDTLIHFIADD